MQQRADYRIHICVSQFEINGDRFAARVMPHDVQPERVPKQCMHLAPNRMRCVTGHGHAQTHVLACRQSHCARYRRRRRRQQLRNQRR